MGRKHLLKYLKLYRKYINIRESQHKLRRNVAASSLKFVCKNLYSVKRYDKTNTNVLCIKSMGKIHLGLYLF